MRRRMEKGVSAEYEVDIDVLVHDKCSIIPLFAMIREGHPLWREPPHKG